MKELPKILKRSIVAKTRVFCIESIQLLFSNGVRADYERLLGSNPGAVLIIPMLDPDTVLLVREYVAGQECYELGLPKGAVDPGEELLEAANRELKEEVGYGAGRLRYMKRLSSSPAYVKHDTHVILAEDLYPERLNGDEPEEIEVVPWRLADLGALIIREDCTDARSIAALLMLKQELQQNALITHE